MKEFCAANQNLRRTVDLPSTSKGYSLYVDSNKRCLIPDRVNHRLISVDKNSVVETQDLSPYQEPYSLTYLSGSFKGIPLNNRVSTLYACNYKLVVTRASDIVYFSFELKT